MNNKIKVYLASGWFTERTRNILDEVESYLTSRDDVVELYSPRRDGVKLTPNEFHDTSLRKKVFADNIEHILNSDIVLANIDSVDSYNDTGTIYEIGYATANNIPVVGYTLSDENIQERFYGILDCFECILKGVNQVRAFLDEVKSDGAKEENEGAPKILFVGAGNEEVDKKIATHILDSGFRLRWIDESNSNIYRNIEEIFDGVDFMISVIDDRKTLVSWMMGQAYARKLPIVTYSDNDYGVNLMLAMSLKTHIKGCDELTSFLQKVKRSGLKSIPSYDISAFKVM